MKYKFNGYEIDSTDLSKEDMPNELFQEMCDLCGIDTALAILANYPGSSIAVPVNGMKKIEEKIILKDYKGRTKDIRDIARKLHVSESYIRDVLKRAKQNVPTANQIGLNFELVSEETGEGINKIA